jgi:cytosine/adenosine deaminase-related metal-dependent hydrolase
MLCSGRRKLTTDTGGQNHVVQDPTSQSEPQALKARYVFPVAGDPIPDGLVTIQGQTILAVGADTSARQIRDLGSAAILPGLINAHTHLEFSHLTAPLSIPTADFVGWLEQVIGLRLQGQEDPLRAVEKGLDQSTAFGTTTLGEIAQPGSSAAPFGKARLEATRFLELIGPTTGRVPPALALAREFIATAPADDGPRVGLSPHAPYSVHPELLQQVVRMSAAERIPIAMHLAESREEIELVAGRSGRFADFLRQLGAWEPGNFPPNGRPLDYLKTLAEAHRALVIHGNYLDDEEIAFLAQRAERMAVVYCPRTHAYFQHAEHPLVELLASGATVALGTDSRASSPDLSVLAEMRFLARRRPSISPDAILRLGTIFGARALGLDRRLGSLEPGKQADLAVIALPDHEAADPHELLFDSQLPVTETWHRGVGSRE